MCSCVSENEFSANERVHFERMHIFQAIIGPKTGPFRITQTDLSPRESVTAEIDHTARWHTLDDRRP